MVCRTCFAAGSVAGWSGFHAGGPRIHVKLMHKVFAVFGLLLGVALTLGSVFLLLHMTVRAELMEDALPRTLAMLGALVAGVFLLMGSVYICTRIAVKLFPQKKNVEIPGRGIGQQGGHLS